MISTTPQRLLALSIAASMAPLTFAQELEPVTVTASRFEQPWENTGSGITVLSGKHLRQQGYSTVSEALASLPGLNTSNTSGEVQFGMRGFAPGGSDLLVLVDGQSINQADISAINFSSISLQNVERIEVSQRSGGVLYGDQAVSGVINIITDQSPAGNASLQFREDGQPSWSVTAPASLSTNTQLTIGWELDQYDGFRDNSGRTHASFFARVNRQLENGELSFQSQYSDTESRFAGSLTKEEAEDDRTQTNTPDEYEQNRTWTHKGSGNFRLSDNFSATVDGTYRTNESEVFQWSALSERERDSAEINPRTLWTPGFFEALDITTGVDVRWADLDYPSLDRSVEQYQYAAYSRTDLRVTNEWTFNAGGRLARTSEDLTDGTMYPEGEQLSQQATALGVGVNWNRGPLHFDAGWEQTFRFAKVDEQAYTEQDVVGLDPQTGNTFEAGAAWRGSARNLDLQVFLIDLEDEIYFDNTADGPGQFPGANVNGEASRRYGATIQWTEYWTPDFWTGASAGYQVAEFTEGDNEGNYMPAVPRWFGGLEIGHRPSEDFTVVTHFRFNGEQYRTNDGANEQDRLDSYTVVDLSFNYRFSRQNDFRVYGRVNNITDTLYYTFASVSDFAADSYYPGNGRNGLIGVSYQF